jgi:hypothetical protein
MLNERNEKVKSNTSDKAPLIDLSIETTYSLWAKGDKSIPSGIGVIAAARNLGHPRSEMRIAYFPLIIYNRARYVYKRTVQ